jgi:hypothetical protein
VSLHHNIEALAVLLSQSSDKKESRDYIKALRLMLGDQAQPGDFISYCKLRQVLMSKTQNELELFSTAIIQLRDGFKVEMLHKHLVQDCTC